MLMMLAIALPILGSVFVFREKDVERVHRLTMGIVFASAALSVGAVFLSRGSFTLLRMSDTLALRFEADMLSRFFVPLVSLIWCLVQFHAFGYMKHEGNESRFFGFFLLTYAALVGLTLAKNAVTLYMCFEFMTLCSMPLVLHSGNANSRAAAFKYLGYSTLGALMALMGFFLLAAQGNALEFTPGGIALAGDRKLLLAAGFLCVLGFGAKAGLVPL